MNRETLEHGEDWGKLESTFPCSRRNSQNSAGLGNQLLPCGNKQGHSHSKFFDFFKNLPFFFMLASNLTSYSVQCSSVTQSCLTLWDPMDCSTPGLPVHHQLSKPAQTHVHWISDAIQPSYPLLSPSPRAFNLSQHQGLYQWISSSHQVAKVLEFQLQHQSFQWIFRTDLL